MYSFHFTAVFCCGSEVGIVSHFLSFLTSYTVEIFEFPTNCKTKRGGVDTHRHRSLVHSLLPPSREQLLRRSSERMHLTACQSNELNNLFIQNKFRFKAVINALVLSWKRSQRKLSHKYSVYTQRILIRAFSHK